MVTQNTGYHGISEEMVRAGTGRGWSDWFAIIDHWNVLHIGHTITVRRLKTHYALSEWWAQAVTYRYERRKGLRM